MKGFFIVLFFLFLISCSNKNENIVISGNKGSAADSIEVKVNALLQKMTLEEKIGQMNQYNGFWDATGPAPESGDNKMKYEHFRKGWVGSVLNVKGVEYVRKLQEIAVKETRLGIPLLFGFDVIHGYKTILPIPLGEAASWDLEAIERSARIAAIEASSVGINWTFAPMVDISRDARWGRVMEGAGEDTYLGSKIGVARIKGFQGADLTHHNTIAACAKHFAGYGFVEAGRDYNTVDVGNVTLYNVIFPPFKAAVESDVKSVMNAFNVLNGIPSTANKFLQRDILKSKWGFKGVVVSDWGSGKELVDHGFSASLEQVAEQAVNAGSDVDMESYAYVTHLKKLVETGKVKIELIDDAVRRILRLKFELGLFDDPYKYCNGQREKELLYHRDHLKDALNIARKSIVLLKNSKQLLPLNQNQKGIAVIGALASDKNSPLGNWRLAADDSSAISVIEGMLNKNISFRYSKGPALVKGPTPFGQEIAVNETDTSGFADAIELAKQSQVIIMVLGEHGMQSGEARSRSKIDLPGLQQHFLEEVYKVNKNIVLVLMNGRPLALPWADKHIPAILEAWQLGTQSGNAITDILFGDYNPSGKLPMTFPRSVGQIPIYYNHYNTGRPGPKNEVFWSHHIDEQTDPLYPFGYGLSYTSFAYAHFKLSSTMLKGNQTLTASVTLTNTGNFKGKETVQLYIRDLVGKVVRPVKELKGFQQVELSPGESKRISFTV
ncbi:MAG TPA: beta-glucosidase BglX, partial [Chitinophagaceae bacterium]|nr:beta-glucosidase BglX [Chitinophagaceae bacterium]